MITTELPNHKGRIYGESRMDWEKGKMVGELHGVLLHDNLRHPSDPCIQMEYDLATGTLTIRAWNDRNKSLEPLHVWTLPDQMFVETCGGDHAASFYLRTGYFDFTCSEDPAVPGIRMAFRDVLRRRDMEEPFPMFGKELCCSEFPGAVKILLHAFLDIRELQTARKGINRKEARS